MLKLIVDSVDAQSMEMIVEQKGPNDKKVLKIRGPYIATEKENKNGRIYGRALMEKVVGSYQKSHIKTGRAMGELEHPATTTINLENVCHLITEIEQNGNDFIGESIVMDTPKGQILQSIILAGGKIGCSTRGVGQVSDKNRVDEEYKLITIDVVHDPSGVTGNNEACFVDGIMESKEFVINKQGNIYEAKYAALENNLSHLPKHEKTQHVISAINTFLKGN